MKTIFNNLNSLPLCLFVALAFCLPGCSSPAPETTTPEPTDTGVVEMEIKNAESMPAAAEPAAATPDAAPSGESSGLSLTPPKS